MKKIILTATLSLMLLLTACTTSTTAPPTKPAAPPTTAVEETLEPLVPIKLETPTPKPAPPTPTPAPTVPAVETIPEDMVLIPAGPFTMGQDGSKPKNGPAHTVDLPAFEIDRFEVTNAEFAHFVEQSGHVPASNNWRKAVADKGNHPVAYISWADAAAYCAWAKKRLPTEAEWEKAARGEDGRAYPWGNEFVAANGNFYEGGFRGTTAGGSFSAGASPYGVEDLAGNVREWTADYFQPYPGAASSADTYFGEQYRVHRGGGWFDGKENEVVTTYNRNFGPPESANDDLGFRCARNAE